MTRLLNGTVAALMVGLGLFGSDVRADDDETRDERIRRQRIRVVDRDAGKFWIGVHAVPIDQALRSQLNLEDCLIVRAVLPDSPAAKAGLEVHDVLLKFGNRKIKNLEDLLEAVSANEDKTVKVVVLRGGKESKLEIQPTERPDNVDAVWPGDHFLRKPLEEWLGSPTERRFRIIGPGVLEELPELPGNLSINITKHNDEPAKITVKRNGKTWAITEDGIDELPEEIREHVRRRVDGRTPRWWMPKEDGTTAFPLAPEGADGPLRERSERMNEILSELHEQYRELLEQRPDIDELLKSQQEEMKALQREVERFRQRISESEPFKALQEEMKALRREIERRREKDQPTDPPETDSRDV